MIAVLIAWTLFHEKERFINTVRLWLTGHLCEIDQSYKRSWTKNSFQTHGHLFLFQSKHWFGTAEFSGNHCCFQSMCNFRLSVDSDPRLLWFRFTSLTHWSRKLAPLSEPIRLKNKTNRDLITWISRASSSLPVFTLISDWLLVSLLWPDVVIALVLVSDIPSKSTLIL